MERDKKGAALDWLREHWENALAFLLILLVYVTVYLLWHMPLEPALYAALLCAVPAVLLAARDFRRFLGRDAALREQMASVGISLERLPEAQGRIERDYQELLTALLAEKNALASQAERSYEEMMDYYTLWVHQIKTPIAAMHLLLQADGTADKRELSQELFQIEQYAEMVLQFLRLKDMSSDLSLTECRLDGVIRQAVKKYAPVFIRRRIALRWEAEETAVLTDEKWLVFVLEQLLSNALKYTPEGGTVSLYMERGTAGRLVIEDTGLGIQSEDLPRLFEKGFTGFNGRLDKRATGLGLYLVKRVLDKLGHGVTLSSAPGRGTRVCLDLSREPVPMVD